MSEQQFDASGCISIQREKRGGYRVNAGRKPSLTRKKPLTIYIDEKLVENGKENLRDFIYHSIKSNYEIN